MGLGVGFSPRLEGRIGRKWGSQCRDFCLFLKSNGAGDEQVWILKVHRAPSHLLFKLVPVDRKLFSYLLSQTHSAAS